jgi:hypothetical protein
MQITVDTKHDSHEDIRKVIAMLRHLVGEKDIFSNSPDAQPIQEEQSAQTLASMFANDASGSSPSPSAQEPSLSPQIVQPAEKKMDDLFSDLLSEEDLPEAKQQPEEEEEDEAPLKKPKIEFY